MNDLRQLIIARDNYIKGDKYKLFETKYNDIEQDLKRLEKIDSIDLDFIQETIDEIKEASAMHVNSMLDTIQEMLDTIKETQNEN